MPDLQFRYHVRSEEEPKIKEQQQDERREYDPFPDAGCEHVVYRRRSDRRTQRMRQRRECCLAVIGRNVFVLDDVQRLDHESLRIVVRAGDVH